MNRDLLYSLGLALAAWPPMFEKAPALEPAEPPRVPAAATLPNPLIEASTPAILEDEDGEPARGPEGR